MPEYMNQHELYLCGSVNALVIIVFRNTCPLKTIMLNIFYLVIQINVVNYIIHRFKKKQFIDLLFLVRQSFLFRIYLIQYQIVFTDNPIHSLVFRYVT